MKLHYKIYPSIILMAITFLLSHNMFATTQTIMVGGPGGMSFVPATGVTINLGDTIKFQWQNGSHTTTSTTIPAGATAWNQNINSSSTTYIYVPAVVGTYNYKCIPHESMGMLGVFNVVCTPPTASSVTPAGPITKCKGDATATLTASAVAGATFQWYKNGSPVSGATSAQFLPDTSGTYTCKTVNGCGNATSNAVVVTINPSPVPAFTVSNSQMAYTFTNTTVGTGLHWDWAFGDSQTSTAKSPTHTYATAGSYMVHLTATDSFGTQCSAMAMQTITVGSPTSVQNINTTDLQLQVSPNPASKQIVVTYKQGNATFKIYDITGRSFAAPKVLSKNSNSSTLDISTLPAGNYILEMKIGDKSATKRIIVGR
ncbi:T9SS type A sorting domain-containing protein [Taibaiella lutea]|uniref:T9SS type A sorting domain-containing protein n=1 Tax=Taibaiella lutea TaxID=2608001 RepID=A0A5M6CIF8_9BACT|nr:PKD domain-containing protein [Taibaiella lutea]KAA5534847.1 T9SS type A sorting domain-containing protein [Taibaiella lutea]